MICRGWVAGIVLRFYDEASHGHVYFYFFRPVSSLQIFSLFLGYGFSYGLIVREHVSRRLSMNVPDALTLTDICPPRFRMLFHTHSGRLCTHVLNPLSDVTDRSLRRYGSLSDVTGRSLRRY